MEMDRSRNRRNIRNSGSDSESQTATKPNKWFLLVGISFGLLCMVQASLNICLRLYFSSDDDVDRCNNVTSERDELQKNLSTCKQMLSNVKEGELKEANSRK
ncbi:hypothetical protein WMY93_008145 [Mugilogobius chulae]|uniref:Uncharacterized protein n=1 Tax=Mugilogobius chulae TaxID=88201 RepID=A0AAW0PQX3_9GOBI